MNSNTTILDSVMGSGKTTWIINLVNNNPERHFIIIVERKTLAGLLSWVSEASNKIQAIDLYIFIFISGRELFLRLVN